MHRSSPLIWLQQPLTRDRDALYPDNIAALALPDLPYRTGTSYLLRPAVFYNPRNSAGSTIYGNEVTNRGSIRLPPTPKGPQKAP